MNVRQTGGGQRFVLLLVPALVTGALPTVAEVSSMDAPVYPLIPIPVKLETDDGVFEIGYRTRIVVSDPSDGEMRRLAEHAAERIRAITCLELNVTDRSPAEGAATVLRLERDPELHPEGYRLEVQPQRIVLASAKDAGLFYGIVTLEQLITERAVDDWVVPAGLVEDHPRFPYRGLHLDVGRHFFPVDFIKRYIDLMASYKLNRFHWHLTEDQGWRIEIKRYPRLTEIGSRRRETILEKNFSPYVGDGTPYGGFYTQDEVREIVTYAAERFVTVIPEIEMPGHSTAALAAYPELACTDGPFEVATTWGVHEDIYCPSEQTFEFLQNVLLEVMELFPSKVIHVGGDEAPKRRWKESKLAQEVIAREGLADEHELQAYFIGRIASFLGQHGRTLMGWDEILEGGLPPETMVMSWRGTAGGIQAARQGHDVVMTPTSHLYFDYYQGDPRHEPLAIGGLLPLEQVYEFDPVPPALSATQARHVLGAQGNVWTEYLATPERVEYMLLPRLLALSEVVWSPLENQIWSSFQRRLGPHLIRLDAEGHTLRVPTAIGLEHERLTLGNKLTLRLAAPVHGVSVRYTTDGSDPTLDSPEFTRPVKLKVDAEGLLVTARVFLTSGLASPPVSARFRKTESLPSVDVDRDRLDPGIAYEYFQVGLRSVDELDGREPDRRGALNHVELPDDIPDERFALVLRGYVRARAGGIYRFHLTSDDGSRLTIGDRVVVDHDGLHGASRRTGLLALRKGYHPIEVRYFQAGGGKTLLLEAEYEGLVLQPSGLRLYRERP